MSSIESHIHALAPDGLRVHIWPRVGGGFQVNVAEPGTSGWTVVHDDDPVAGVREALRQRVGGISSRVVEAVDDWAAVGQIDLEDAIAATVDGQTVTTEAGCDACDGLSRFGCEVCDPSPVDPFQDLLG